MKGPRTLIRETLNALAGGHRGCLLVVGDGAGWIIDRVASALVAHLPPSLGPQRVTRGWQSARDCVIHLMTRNWAWSDGILDDVHESNRLIGVWWHGQIGSNNEGIVAALERLARLHPRFACIQVTCRIAQATVRDLGVADERIRLLPEGVDLSIFRPPRSQEDRARARALLKIPPDAIAIGCFQKDGQGWGAGEEPKLIKGPDVLAGVLTKLRKHYPVHAVIPGPARGYLKRCLADASVPFSAPGFESSARLPCYYHALDLYISPSRDEGGPAGVLESMASGVPVASTRTGMPADMIDHGRNGFLADIDDREGLARHAATLIETPELRLRVAEVGLVTIQAYGWTQLAERYAEELYRPLLGVARSRPE